MKKEKSSTKETTNEKAGKGERVENPNVLALRRVQSFCDNNADNPNVNIQVTLEAVRLLTDPKNEHILSFDLECPCGKTHGEELAVKERAEEDDPDEEDEDEAEDDEDDSEDEDEEDSDEDEDEDDSDDDEDEEDDEEE